MPLKIADLFDENVVRGPGPVVVEHFMISNTKEVRYDGHASLSIFQDCNRSFKALSNGVSPRTHHPSTDVLRGVMASVLHT